MFLGFLIVGAIVFYCWVLRGAAAGGGGYTADYEIDTAAPHWMDPLHPWHVVDHDSHIHNHFDSSSGSSMSSNWGSSWTDDDHPSWSCKPDQD